MKRLARVLSIHHCGIPSLAFPTVQENNACFVPLSTTRGYWGLWKL